MQKKGNPEGTAGGGGNLRPLREFSVELAGIVAERLCEIGDNPDPISEPVKDFLNKLQTLPRVAGVAFLISNYPRCGSTLLAEVITPIEKGSKSCDETTRSVSEAVGHLSDRLKPTLPVRHRFLNTGQTDFAELELKVIAEWYKEPHQELIVLGLF